MTSPQASVPGEIVPAADFYTYDAKYFNDRSELLIPAPLTPKQSRQVRDIAVRAYRAETARAWPVWISCWSAALASCISARSTPSRVSPASACTPSCGLPAGFRTRNYWTVSSHWHWIAKLTAITPSEVLVDRNGEVNVAGSSHTPSNEDTPRTRRNRRSEQSPSLLERVLPRRPVRRYLGEATNYLTSRPQSVDRSRPRVRKPVHTAQAGASWNDERRMPPVLVRGAAVPGVQSRRTASSGKARRRYDISLNVPGAEMRLPAIPQVQFGWRMLSSILVVLLGFGLYQLWNAPRFRITDIDVTGLQRLTVSDVNAVLDVIDLPIFSVDGGLLTEQLKAAFPEFSSVSVDTSLPNKVNVVVEERVPILTWKQDGRTLLADANGVVFPVRSELTTFSPIVEALSSPPNPSELELAGEGQKPYLPVEMVSAILSMSAQAPKDTPLLYDAQHGLGWKDPQGWEVYFGDMGDMGLKLNIYSVMVQKLQSEGITPALVSVEYVHARITGWSVSYGRSDRRRH